MTYVACEESEGLRESESTVGVLGLDRFRRFLRVEKSFLERENGHAYLPIGVVLTDAARKRALIELPLEADSGEARLWVELSQLREARE